MNDSSFNLALDYININILQVLFLELKLPPNGEIRNQGSKKTLGATRRVNDNGHKLKLGKKFSTSKVLLGAMARQNPNYILHFGVLKE